MNRIFIYVEGYTEEGFVKKVLAPYLQSLSIFIIPKIKETKPVKNGPNFKGGYTTYAKTKRNILRLIGDTKVVAITTMLDYYGLPNDFPGIADLPANSCYDKVLHLEKAFRDDIGSQRFIPFLTLHEFEALLFSSPREFDPILPDTNASHGIQKIRDKFNTPEEINNGKDTHPSKRILNIVSSFRKRVDGPRIAKRIGLDTIRRECPHFNDWLTALENLAD